jgi:hypothetical protein
VRKTVEVITSDLSGKPLTEDTAVHVSVFSGHRYTDSAGSSEDIDEDFDLSPMEAQELIGWVLRNSTQDFRNKVVAYLKTRGTA